MTDNPYTAFQVEAELQKQLINLGGKYPSERMFKVAGAGGFNPQHHFHGKTYGVYLLAHAGGPPEGWTLKAKFLSGGGVVCGQKRSRDEDGGAGPDFEG